VKQANLQFSQIAIHFNYAFDLGKAINPVDAARQLLATDFAEAFINYSTGENEIANRYQPYSDLYHQYLQFKQVITEWDEEPSRYKSYLKLVKMLRTSMGREFIFHLFKSYFSHNNSGEDIEDLQSTSIPNGEADNGTIDLEDVVADFVQDLLSSLAIQEGVDRTIFHEDYLEKGSFARVSLKPFQAVFDKWTIVFDVAVTIHHSGVAILTAYGFIKDILSVDDILALDKISLFPVYTCEIPSSIFNRYDYFLSQGTMSEKEIYTRNAEFYVDDHPGYLRFDIEQGGVFAGLLDAYRYTIIEKIQNKRYKSLDSLHQSLRSNHYFGYPIIFIKQITPQVTTASEFKKRYTESLSKLVAGYKGKSKLKSEIVEKFTEKDLAAADTYSFFMTEGKATILYFASSNFPESILSAEWYHDRFMVTSVLDILILQKAILKTYSVQIDRTTLNLQGLKHLNEIKRNLLIVLDDYAGLEVSHYGSVKEMLDVGKELLLIKDENEIFNQRLHNLEGLIQIEESNKRSAKEQLLQTLAIIATLIFSFGQVTNFVDAVSSWSSTPSQIYPVMIQIPYIWIVECFRARPVFSTILIYLLIIVVFSITLARATVVSWFRRNYQIVPAFPEAKSKLKTLSPMKFTVRSKED
jgi:hypothetical protein